VTNPKGLNAEASLSSDSPFSVELALTVTLRVVGILLLQQYVAEEMARLRVGENIAEKAIVGFVISVRGELTVQSEHNHRQIFLFSVYLYLVAS